MTKTIARGGVSRRQFLTGAGIAGLTLAGMGLSGCAPDTSGGEAQAEGAGEADSASPGWLGEPPAIADADCVETLECEVLVVGAGDAGTYAACFAADEGAKVLLIDSSETGAGIRGSAQSAVNSSLQQAAGVDINKEDIINDITMYALNQTNMALPRLWADNSGEALDWYTKEVEDNGLGKIVLEYSMPPQPTRYKMWPTGHGTANPTGYGDCDEQAILKHFIGYIEQRGGEYRNLTRMLCLIKEGEKVIGAYAENADGQYIRINASKGVIVATGGYINNEEMWTALQGDYIKTVPAIFNFGHARGDGIKACLWAGAVKDEIATSMYFDRAALTPEAEVVGPYASSGWGFFGFSSQPWLKVAKSGKRLCNESAPYDFIVHAANKASSNGTYYVIWDSSYWEDVLRFHTIGCSSLFKGEGRNHQTIEEEGVKESMAQLVEGGQIVVADTVEELAEKLLLDDPELFAAEVEKYNGWFDAGYDGEFGKDPFRLSRIDEPPYYGMRCGGAALCTLDGIKINEKFQAIDAEGKPIEGLYVIGNDSGSYYAHTYPNFAAGLNAGRCSTFGMLCGRQVAKM